MTAATVTAYYNTQLHEEVVLLSVTDGYTYTTKMSKPLVAFATANVDIDGEINCTISGRTVTINAVGASGSAVALLIKGYL